MLIGDQREMSESPLIGVNEMVPLRLNFRNVIVVAILAVGTSHCMADDLKPSKGTSPLGIRQQRVKRMMQELDRKFQDLAQKLQATEPEQAKLLIKAFQQSRERLIEQRMEEISHSPFASLIDVDLGADLDAAIEVDDIGVHHADAA